MLASRSAGSRCWRAAPWGYCAASVRSVTSWHCAGWSRRWRAVADRRPQRLAALLDALSGAHLDALLLTSLPNIRYITGFSGSSALVLVSQRQTLFITDFRYETQAAVEVGELARVSVQLQSLWAGLWQQVAQLPGLEVIGFESPTLHH